MTILHAWMNSSSRITVDLAVTAEQMTSLDRVGLTRSTSFESFQKQLQALNISCLKLADINNLENGENLSVVCWNGELLDKSNHLVTEISDFESYDYYIDELLAPSFREQRCAADYAWLSLAGAIGSFRLRIDMPIRHFCKFPNDSAYHQFEKHLSNAEISYVPAASPELVLVFNSSAEFSEPSMVANCANAFLLVESFDGIYTGLEFDVQKILQLKQNSKFF